MHRFILLVFLGLFLATNASAFAGNWNSSSQLEKMNLDFGQPISEIYFLDTHDVNQDGIDDFVISALVDVEKQVGVHCCNVPPALVPKIQKISPLLLLSNKDGSFEPIAFPEEAKTIRSWAGKFFEHKSRLFFFLGRNGEISDAVDGNSGESSLLFEIKREAANTQIFELVADTGVPATTASVDVVKGGSDGIYIVENNYLDFSWRDPHARSYVYSFAGENALSLAPFKPGGFDQDKANNELKIVDVDADGDLDVIVSAETMFHFDNGQKKTDKSGTYIIYDPLANPRRAVLPSPYFGKEHAGFHSVTVDVNGALYLIEIGVRLAERNQFMEPALSLYKFNDAAQAERVDVDYSRDFTAEKFQMSGMQLVDMDFDGIDEVFLQSFSDAPMYLKYDKATEVFRLLKVSQEAYQKPKSGKGRAIIISTNKLKPCHKIVSVEDWNRAEKPEISISKTCVN